MKKGRLQFKKQSLEAKQRKNSTHMRGRARICVLLKDLSTPRQLWPRLGVAPWLPLTTHRRGSPRIYVGSQQLTFQSHVNDKPKRDQDFLKPQSSTHRRRRSTHMCGRHLGSKQPRMTHA
ncbi:hypothetical protein PIB30_102569 [Stylosanthes scabra]|uniref:Uncharacterized protein n=1 Tax=Stylosanthes scabra TaxID=79078 RepID=A0ABU6TZ63_9FABA|nr:hypothetical protein [Stylosanthes scabra]